jgi:hypothetical protein
MMMRYPIITLHEMEVYSVSISFINQTPPRCYVQVRIEVSLQRHQGTPLALIPIPLLSKFRSTMDAQRQARYRRLPRLIERRVYCTSHNPLPNARAPDNCEELETYLADIKLLGRVKDEEWHTFQPFFELVESGVWRWHRQFHNTILSQLQRLSGTLFIPGGIYVYPHLLENIYAIAPRDRGDLVRYLTTICAHGLVPYQHLEDLRVLCRVVMTRSWDWNEAQHQHVLDGLQEATGVLFTLRGPFHLARGAVLEDAPGTGTRRVRHEHAEEAGTPRRRIGTVKREDHLTFAHRAMPQQYLIQIVCRMQGAAALTCSKRPPEKLQRSQLTSSEEEAA